MKSPNLGRPGIVVRKKGEISLDGESIKALLKEVLQRGKKFRFQAKGFSMQPFIRNGDVITLAPLVDRTIQIGDVGACEEPVSGKLIVHRVVGKKGAQYLIKGDNAFKIDGLVDRKAIFGRVVKIERRGKTVSFSLGPEKKTVAMVSRDVIGRRFLFYLWKLIWLLRRGFVK